MTFHTVDFSGSVTSGKTPSDSARKNKKNETFSSGQAAYDELLFQRLLNERDVRLRSEMDRRETEHQAELATLRGELYLLKNNNSSGNTAPYEYDESSDLLNDLQHMEQAKPDTTDILQVNNADDEEEGVDLPLLPEDTFSYLAVSKWTSAAMYIALFVFAIQAITLSVLALDFASTISDGNRLGVPISVSTNTAIIQVVALFIIVFSQGDLQDSLNLLFMGYDGYELKKNFKREITYKRWLWSLLTRLFVALFGLAVTFVMIVRESDVTQLLLDFTSIEFVTNIDNVFFWLTAWGYIGNSAQRDATLIALAKAPQLVQEADEGVLSRRGKPKRHLHVKRTERTSVTADRAEMGGRSGHMTRDLSHSQSSIDSSRTLQEEGLMYGKVRKGRCMSRFPRMLFLIITYLMMIVGWGTFHYWQRTGSYFCKTLFIQWNDVYNPELATFSGLYDLQCDGACSRAEYMERGHGSFSKTAKFFYCEEEEVWVFGIINSSSLICNDWKARSARQAKLAESSFDIIASVDEGWSVQYNEGIVPLPSFTLKCFDCQFDDEICGKNGDCVNNQCVCHSGYHGYRCEFSTPCDKIELDPAHKKSGSRKWAGEYSRMHLHDHGHTTNSSLSGETDIVILYNRPVYVGGGDGSPIEFIFYNGRRWVNVVQEDAGIKRTHEELVELITSFHGYWSNYSTSFLSEPVDVDTPEDSTDPRALEWLKAASVETVKDKVQGPDMQEDIIGLKLLCATCSDDTNPCLYESQCSDFGVCDCIQGKEGGKLCQIPPSGNGRCDEFFNTPRFSYDGGDCCESTCISTAAYECGKKEKNVSFGSTIEYVGFPTCKDPNAVNQVSGSQTLFHVKKRGKVICGIYTSSLMNEFFTKQCESIAAALFGNSSAYELGIWGGTVGVNRFLALDGGEFDIVFGSDFTANRDIFEKVSRASFSFAPMPYYFAGLTFAGVPEFVQCADNLDVVSPSCQDLMICISKQSTWYDLLTKLLPPDKVLGTPGIVSNIPALKEGLCNVHGGTRFDILPETVRESGWDDSFPYVVGDKMHTKSFETWMTQGDDRQWSKFVSWVFEALVQAEESGITSETASLRMAKTDVFEKEFENMFIHAVEANGNFGEIWDTSMPFPRPPVNKVCDGTSGLIVAMALGAFETEGPRPSSDGRISHIEKIIERGALKCRVSEAPGFASYDEVTSLWSGFEVDICKGISAALFKGQSKVDFVAGSVESTFQGIINDDIDLALGMSRTLEREVKNSRNSGVAFDFSPAYFYDGLVFGGPMPYGKCASELIFDDDNNLGLACKNTTICVSDMSTWLDAMRGPLKVPQANLVLTTGNDESLEKHISGECNVIAQESHKIKGRLSAAGYPLETTDYYIGEKMLTKEILSVMHLSDDPQFSAFVRWVVYGLFHAEENKITSLSYLNMPSTKLFGSELAGIWQNSVREVGNYGEMFERNLNGTVVRAGLNLLNELDGPQLCASPGTAKSFSVYE